MPALIATSFEPLDWAVVLVYMLVVVAIGVQIGRRQKGVDDFFLGSRSMSLWPVAISVLATALSAATFIGGPEQAFKGDLTYLTTNLGALIAAIIVASVFLPRFYRANVTSVYELLGYELGSPARHAASAMFQIGRVFASGARLFIVAIPFAWIVFGPEPARHEMMVAIGLIAVAATAYTTVGGIRAVIWTDVLQAVVLVGTIAVAFVLLWSRLGLSWTEISSVLSSTPAGDGDPASGLGSGKLRWLDLGLDPSRPYTLPAVLVGFTLFNMAAYGTDQDLAQRMLTCRSARAGGWSVILANVISWPVTALFLGLGLLLYIFYRDQDVGDGRDVFVRFILNEMPSGLRGLMIAGLFAAAMSSLDSALSAMASATVADFYRPWRVGRLGRTRLGHQRELKLARVLVVCWGVVLAGFACFCVYWHEKTELPLIDFALGVMVFAYSGLLAVFLTAICTRRGNAWSAIAALVTGFLIVALFETWIWSSFEPANQAKEWVLDRLPGGLAEIRLAFPWKMVIATTGAFLVCCLGRRAPGSSLQT
jgi:SSS family transporter